jgi:hypothetical protein
MIISSDGGRRRTLVRTTPVTFGATIPTMMIVSTMITARAAGWRGGHAF